jgi:hypothetical protein
MTATESHSKAVEAAKDQSLFREVNERMKDVNEAFEHPERDSEFICECANRNCTAHVVLTLTEYEQVRLVPTHFVVLPGMSHVFPDVERVVEGYEGYFVVEKFGDAGAAAVKLDPRSRHRRDHVSGLA